MKQSTVNNHTNPRPTYNCTHVNAWVLGKKIEKWSRHNITNLFRPPVFEAVAIVPQKFNPDDDQFSRDMFEAGQLLSDTPLNHYLRLRRRNNPNTFLVNAGFLLSRFLLGDKIGYVTLKGALDLAEEEFTPTNNTDTPSTGGEVSIEGADE